MIENMFYFEDTASTPKRIMHEGHNFIWAFVEAYNSHGDVVLSPDEIWIQICSFFNKYVNDNAEKLRDKFVTH